MGQSVVKGPAECHSSKIKNQKQQLTNDDDESTVNQKSSSNGTGIMQGSGHVVRIICGSCSKHHSDSCSNKIFNSH